MDFAVRADHRIKLKESEKSDRYFDLAREFKKKTNKLWNMKVTVVPVVIGTLGTVTKGLVPRTGRLGNKRTSGDNQNYSITEIAQNTKKSSGDLKKLVVS